MISSFLLQIVAYQGLFSKWCFSYKFFISQVDAIVIEQTWLSIQTNANKCSSKYCLPLVSHLLWTTLRKLRHTSTAFRLSSEWLELWIFNPWDLRDLSRLIKRNLSPLIWSGSFRVKVTLSIAWAWVKKYPRGLKTDFQALLQSRLTSVSTAYRAT